MIVEYSNAEMYGLLSKICNQYGLSASFPRESKHYFQNLLSGYEGNTDKASVSSWLDEHIPSVFVALHDRPHWIQEPEWPFYEGKPMIFVGQLDLSVEDGKLSEYFHDDASFFVFVQSGGISEVVIQLY